MNSNRGVSVIIPVYNVEESIERCARSLFEQTFKELEFVFVNDCSADNSIPILRRVINEYPERKGQIKIVNHDHNKGVGSARNTGLGLIEKEYLLFGDSDDWAESTMIEELVLKAQENNSEMVWCDFYVDLPDEKKSIYRHQEVSDQSAICIDRILTGSLHGGLWNKLLRKSVCISNNIRFAEGINMCEDLVFNIIYLCHVNRVTYLSRAFYHYVQNSKSITISRTRQSFESELNAVKILEVSIPMEIFGESVAMYKARIKRNLFFSGLFTNDEYLNCFPEATKYIFRGLNFIDKFAVWLSLKGSFLPARTFLRIGKVYASVKMSVNQ